MKAPKFFQKQYVANDLQVPDTFIPKDIDMTGRCKICQRLMLMSEVLPATIAAQEMAIGIHFDCWAKEEGLQ